MTKMPKILFAGLMASTMLVTPLVAAEVPAGVKLADDQTFTYRIASALLTLDPQLNQDVDGSDFLRDLFEGLYNQDGDGNLVPAGALSHTVNASKDVYTFKLRPESVWSNGDPVVAADYVYAWQRLATPELASDYAWYIELMSVENASQIVAGEMDPSTLGVTAIDDHTLEVRLTQPLPYFASMTTLVSTYPVHQATVEAHGDAWTDVENIVVNGAYTLTEHTPDERTVRERNTTYWNNDSTILDKVVLLVINDENIALTRYFAGELNRTDVPAGQFPKLKAEYPLEAKSVPSLCTYYYNVNMTDSAPEALSDVRVRQALSLAIDRDIIVEKVTAGGQTAAYTFTPGATAGFEVPDVPAASMTQAERDAKAVSLLAESGYGSDLELNILYNTSEAHKKVAIAVTQMWKQKLGINAGAVNQEWGTFLENRQNQNYELSRAGWCGDYNEASTFLDLAQSGSGYNDAKYNNPEVDALLADAKTSDNPQAIYTEVEQKIANDVPFISIYHYAEVNMMNSDVQGWPFNNVQNKWYSKDLYKTAE